MTRDTLKFGDGPSSSDAGTMRVASAQPRATLADVGKLAGVSSKTVSRVMLGDKKVAEPTRERVLAAARTLRFRPNQLASSLRQGSTTNVIAFVIGDLTNPFYALVAAGAERELARHGLMMILASTDDDPTSEERVVETLLRQRVRALIMVPISQDQSYLEGERQLGTPVICVDRPAHNLIADSVVLDNRNGMAQAVRKLTGIGHRRIAFVSSPVGLHTDQQRLAGYEDALQEAGIPVSSELVQMPQVYGTVAESVRELMALPEPPTALVAANNKISSIIIHALQHRLESVAFVGFDDFELADLTDISVVAYDAAELGRVAARLAIARLEDPVGAPAHQQIPTTLIARGSGEKPPILAPQELAN
ncbi:LacI family DNA-binding transcriptional regulator [Arthrobacter tumbae]